MNELVGKLRAELAHQKLLSAHMALQTKMEEHKKLMEELKEQREMDALKQQTDQQETNDKIDSLKKDQQEQYANIIREMEQKQKEELQRNIQAMVVAELEEQKLSNANKFAEIEQKNVLQQEKVVKLEKYQKEQQLYIVDLQKTVALLREIGLNRWDPTACDDKLALFESDRLIVQHNGQYSDWSSVRRNKCGDPIYAGILSLAPSPPLPEGKWELPQRPTLYRKPKYDTR